MSNVLKPIQDFVEKVEAFYHAEEPKLLAAAESFLEKVENAVVVGLEDIAELCGAAVLEEGMKVATGAEKFGNAVTAVYQKVEAGALGEGKAVLLSTVQTGVQIAFSTAKTIAGDAKASGLIPPASTN